MRARWIGVVASFATVAFVAVVSAGEVVVRPEAAPGPLDNPLKGWCPYTDAGPIRQPYSMVFLYAPWKWLEPEDGRFAFEQWERRDWSVLAAQGKHVVLRVYIDYPSSPSGLPDWLNKEVKSTPYTEHGGGVSPDYDNPRMVAAMERLIAAMGRRYDRNPRVAFIELGLLGFWGEWHTWPRDALYARRDTERRVIEAYRLAFPNKVLMGRYARGHAGSQPWLGFHDDLFPQDTDNGQDWSFLAGLRRSGRTANWERAAIGGEMVPGRAKQWLGEKAEQTTRMVERGHFSWVGPYCPALDNAKSPEFRHQSESLVRRMGYQFRLTEVQHNSEVETGATLPVAIRGVNEGVAPFYYPWPVELALIDDTGRLIGRRALTCDLRTWLPGPFEVEGRLEAKASPGRYKLSLGVIDLWTGRPAIQFANKLPTHEGWTVLSTVTVAAGR